MSPVQLNRPSRKTETLELVMIRSLCFFVIGRHEMSNGQPLLFGLISIRLTKLNGCVRGHDRGCEAARGLRLLMRDAWFSVWR